MRKALFLTFVAALALLAGSAAYAQTAVTLSVKFADDAVYSEVETAICVAYAYADQVPALDAQGKPILDAQGQPTTVANPETRKGFVRRQMKKWLLAMRDGYLNTSATNTAVATSKAARKVEAETP